MKCPLQMIGELIRCAVNDTNWDKDNVDCDEEECAWWNDWDNECSILSIGKLRDK